jgi:hypothetical protein
MREMQALVKYGTRQLEEVFKQTLLSDGGAGSIEPLQFIMKGPFGTSDALKQYAHLCQTNRFRLSQIKPRVPYG